MTSHDQSEDDPAISNRYVRVTLGIPTRLREGVREIRHSFGRLPSMALLTPRERDVVRFVAEGMRNQEIALKLHLSEHTVRNYLLRIFDKLGIAAWNWSSMPLAALREWQLQWLPERMPLRHDANAFWHTLTLKVRIIVA